MAAIERETCVDDGGSKASDFERNAVSDRRFRAACFMRQPQ
jgi:hypothetical protein